MHTRSRQGIRTQPSLTGRRPGLLLIAALLGVALTLTGCSGKDKKESKDSKKTEATAKKPTEQITKKMSTSDVLNVDAQFKTFIGLVKTAGLTKTLDDQKLTLFIPNSDAFAALEEGAIDELSKDHEALRAYLEQYMVKGNLTVNDLVPKIGKELDTLSDTKLKVGETEDHLITVNGAKVIKYDIATSTSTVHVMDQAFAP